MHPTPEEQLQAAVRLIDTVAADRELQPSSLVMLEDAGRLLRRLERSLAHRLPFLIADNELAGELLVSLTPLLPTLQAEISKATNDLRSDEPSAHATNKRLNDLMGQAVHLLPANDDGDHARAQIASHLRDRLATDPTLHRAVEPRSNHRTTGGSR